MSDQDFRNRFLRLMEENKNKSPEQLTEEFGDDNIPLVNSPN
jgi:hypothetical protein